MAKEEAELLLEKQHSWLVKWVSANKIQSVEILGHLPFGKKSNSNIDYACGTNCSLRHDSLSVQLTFTLLSIRFLTNLKSYSRHLYSNAFLDCISSPVWFQAGKIQLMLLLPSEVDLAVIEVQMYKRLSLPIFRLSVNHLFVKKCS